MRYLLHEADRPPAHASQGLHLVLRASGANARTNPLGRMEWIERMTEFEEMYEKCCICGRWLPSAVMRSTSTAPTIPRCDDCWKLRRFTLMPKPIPLAEWFEEDRPWRMTK